MQKVIGAILALLVLPAATSADPIIVTANAARVFVVGGGGPRALIDVWHQDRTPIIEVNIMAIFSTRSHS